MHGAFFNNDNYTTTTSLPCRSHLSRLCGLVQSGQLAVALDSHSSRFRGLAAVPDAVDRLQSGQSSGKVVVQLAEQLPMDAQAKL